MGKHQDHEHLDIWYASMVDAAMEFIGTLVAGLRLTCPNATTLRALVPTGDQVPIGINGLWRYRTTNHDVSLSGAAGLKKVFVVAPTANDYDHSGSPPDIDNTDYNWELRVLASGATPTGVEEYREVAELDWDGSKVTGMRQIIGLGDATGPITPTSPTPGMPAVVVKAADGQTANIFEVRLFDGTLVARLNSAGKFLSQGLDAAELEITNVAEPTVDDSAATRGYVKSKVGLLHPMTVAFGPTDAWPGAGQEIRRWPVRLLPGVQTIKVDSMETVLYSGDNTILRLEVSTDNATSWSTVTGYASVDMDTAPAEILDPADVALADRNWLRLISVDPGTGRGGSAAVVLRYN